MMYALFSKTHNKIEWQSLNLARTVAFASHCVQKINYLVTPFFERPPPIFPTRFEVVVVTSMKDGYVTTSSLFRLFSFDVLLGSKNFWSCDR